MTEPGQTPPIRADLAHRTSLTRLRTARLLVAVSVSLALLAGLVMQVKLATVMLIGTFPLSALWMIRTLPPADPAREAAQIARLRALASSAKLDPDFAEKFLAFVIKEVIRHHESLRSQRVAP